LAFAVRSESPLTPPAIPTASATTGTLAPVGYRVANVAFRRQTQAELPYQSGPPVSLTNPPYRTDRFGVRVDMRNGVAHYAPVPLAQQGLQLIHGYRATKDGRYLDVAAHVAARLSGTGRRSGSALYLAYDFDFRMHGRASETLRAPWYSGMAQGLAISFFLRLHLETGDARYRATADELMAAISRLRTSDRTPWVSTIDSRGYLWIEEYPLSHDHTLNGYLFALLGVYEYWLATGSRSALRVLRGGVATLVHYLPQFRNPGAISAYCLKHRVQSAGYHRTHIWQLERLAGISGVKFFSDMSAAFRADFH
jgi:hypothetical protein